MFKTWATRQEPTTPGHGPSTHTNNTLTRGGQVPYWFPFVPPAPTPVQPRLRPGTLQGSPSMPGWKPQRAVAPPRWGQSGEELGQPSKASPPPAAQDPDTHQISQDPRHLADPSRHIQPPNPRCPPWHNPNSLTTLLTRDPILFPSCPATVGMHPSGSQIRPQATQEPCPDTPTPARRGNRPDKSLLAIATHCPNPGSSSTPNPNRKE
ncbi:hypothetical protein CRENBAI_018551 [Crenichthys baileyi]|uniref:Uncharacterized protein n=1 Tax=Crenichthys baileyi TaxID=28760 RepID=A0AAV9RQM1_9TELE